MYHFKHPNVLTLTGVCLDGGPAPYIILPFMANDSLLAYLKKNKATLNVSRDSCDDNDGEVHNVMGKRIIITTRFFPFALHVIVKIIVFDVIGRLKLFVSS